MMKYVAPVFVFTSSMLLAQDRIEEFRWKHRLLVISGADDRIVERLRQEEAGIGERDLRVFILSGSGTGEYAAKDSLAQEFRKRLKPSVDEPTAHLIGKDGKTTLTWPLREFSFDKLYTSIDAMPMRMREMRVRE